MRSGAESSRAEDHSTHGEPGPCHGENRRTPGKSSRRDKDLAPLAVLRLVCRFPFESFCWLSFPRGKGYPQRKEQEKARQTTSVGREMHRSSGERENGAGSVHAVPEQRQHNICPQWASTVFLRSGSLKWRWLKLRTLLACSWLFYPDPPLSREPKSSVG